MDFCGEKELIHPIPAHPSPSIRAGPHCLPAGSLVGSCSPPSPATQTPSESHPTTPTTRLALAATSQSVPGVPGPSCGSGFAGWRLQLRRLPHAGGPQGQVAQSGQSGQGGRRGSRLAGSRQGRPLASRRPTPCRSLLQACGCCSSAGRGVSVGACEDRFTLFWLSTVLLQRPRCRLHFEDHSQR